MTTRSCAAGHGFLDAAAAGVLAVSTPGERAGAFGEAEQDALGVFVRERVERLQRAAQLGELQVRGLQGEPAGPADGGGVEAFLGFALDDQQDPEGVARVA